MHITFYRQPRVVLKHVTYSSRNRASIVATIGDLL